MNLGKKMAKLLASEMGFSTFQSTCIVLTRKLTWKVDPSLPNHISFSDPT